MFGHCLGDEVMAAALIDRLVHYCHIVNIRGELLQDSGSPKPAAGRLRPAQQKG